MPSGPPIKATGMNTDAITSEMAMIAPLISFMAFSVASTGESLLREISTFTASITTIASSTTIPIAMTKAKSEIMLSVMLNTSIAMKLPNNEIGMAKIGMTAARQSPRKMNTTMPTKTKASISVWITFSILASRNRLTS